MATIVGVLGESNRMTDAEREALIRAAVDEASNSSFSKFPICVGTLMRVQLQQSH